MTAPFKSTYEAQNGHEKRMQANYPRYSDLMKITYLSRQIRDAEEDLQKILDPRTHSIGHAYKSTGTQSNDTEDKALRLAERREELDALRKSFCDLFRILEKAIKDGPGDPELKYLVFFLFLYDMPLKKARTLAGWNKRQNGDPKERLEEYLDACKRQENERNLTE